MYVQGRLASVEGLAVSITLRGDKLARRRAVHHRVYTLGRRGADSDESSGGGEDTEQPCGLSETQCFYCASK
eukprot:2970518-Rhodomonas_salina.1